MPTVTQRVDNYLGGVSRQSDDKKLPGQVRECLNGYPDPTFGLTKRPGFKYLTQIILNHKLNKNKLKEYERRMIGKPPSVVKLKED